MNADRHARRVRTAAARVTLAGASLAVTLLAAEIATRLFSAIERPLDARDPRVGKTYEPGYAGTVYVEECDCDVFLRFNREGFRGPDLAFEKARKERRVALIGDSMVAAVATAEEATAARRMEDLMNASAASTPGDSPQHWRVMNFGVSGASTGQELALYRERVRRYRPDVVVLAFFLRNDVIDNSPRLGTNPRIYFDLDESGQPLQRPFSERRADQSAWLNRNSRFYVWQKYMLARMHGRWGRLDRSRLSFAAVLDDDLAHAWRLTAVLLDRFRREVEADGARFLVAALPPAELVYDDVWSELGSRAPAHAPALDRESPERRLREICARADIGLVTMSEAFRAAAPSRSSAVASERLYFDGIGHFDARGNDLAARAIVRALAGASANGG